MAIANGAFRTPPVVANLLIINILVFLAEILLPGRISNALLEFGALSFWKGGDFHIWQPLTYMFLHANFGHIFFNMFALWMFGRGLEYDLGSRRFLTYYIVCGIGAGLIQLGVNWIEYAAAAADPGVPPALLARYAHTYTIVFPPIALKAKWFVVIYGVIELVAGISGRGGVAHFAHLGGMLFGWLLLWYWKKKGWIYY